jgi:retinol dehydrogenase 12
MALRDLSSAVALVTGATGGIGLEVARGLAAMKATVLVHGRTQESAQAAITTLREHLPKAKLVPVAADVSSLAGMDALVSAVRAHTKALHILVNNAGVYQMQKQLSADGYELTFAVNTLAPFRLVSALLPLLKAGAPARVVNVSSTLHVHGELDIGDLSFSKRSFDGLAAYRQSKLALTLLNTLWADEIDAAQVSFHAVHPGMVATGITRDMHGPMRLMRGFFNFFAIRPDQGAKTVLYAATDPDLPLVSGGYYAHCELADPSPLAHDRALGEALVKKLEQLLAVTAPV